MRYVCRTAAGVAVLAFLIVPEVRAQDVPGLSITNYQLVSEQRWSRTQSYMTYRADLVNTGPGRDAVTATVRSLVPSIEVVPGESNLHFSPVPAGGRVTSSNTFTILVDRTLPFDTTNLRWSFLAPWANAGGNQTVRIGETVTLNGSKSTNPSGVGTLSYKWSFVSRPFGTSTKLIGTESVIATFIADAPGQYVVLLTVTNGVGTDTSTAVISTVNSPPVANAGPNQTVGLGSQVYLTGAGSSDVDGDPLTYSWTFISRPSGSLASLSSSTAVAPSFTADKAGTYILKLVVNDGKADSPASTVQITTQNTPPVANAGANQAVKAGAVVQLSGAASTDVDGDPLTYHWQFNSVPVGSTAALSNRLAVNPSFTADKAGTYVVQLIVNDGRADSGPATVTITTDSIQPPTASAGPNQTVKHGDSVLLTGTGTDPQGLPLSFHWSITSKPSGSTATLSSATNPRPTFTADVPGQYVVQLIVNNGYLNSSPSTATITTTNTPPVAAAGPNQTVQPGATVNLNGSASSDADGDTLSYAWSLITRPSGSAAALSGAGTATPSFVADVGGTYVAQLIVSDKFVSSDPTTVTITAGVKAITLSPTPLNVSQHSFATLTISIGSPAGPGGVDVRLASSDPGILSVPSTVNVPQGQTSMTITVNAGSVGTALILATATGFAPGSVTANVTVPGIALALDASTIGVTATTKATITLSDPVPAGGVIVGISALPAGVVTVPASVTIGSGTTGTFTVAAAGTGMATITARIPGYNAGSAVISVSNLGAIRLESNVTVGPGKSVPFGVALVTPAPVGGVTINLTSTAPTIATISPSVFIPQGATAPDEPAKLTGVNFGSANIIASAPGFQNDTQLVRVTGALSFSPGNLTLGAGGSGNLTLNLSAPAPAGLIVNLSSDKPAVASVAASVSFPAGATSVSVPVTGASAGTAIIHASALPHLTDTTATVSVATLGTIELPANATVGLGQTVSYAISLSVPAPAGGTVVTLTSSDPLKLVFSSATVSIPAGSTTPSAAPQITGKAPGPVNITAAAPAYGSATATATVTAALAFSPATIAVQVGSTQSVMVTLPAPAATPVVVTLTSDNTSVVTVPASLTIPANAVGASVTLTGVAAGSTKIRATSSGLTAAEATVNVQTGGIIGLPSNVTVPLGGTAPFAITLPKAAAARLTITLATSDASKASISPSTVVIEAGQTVPASQPNLTGVSVGTATISASATGYTSASQSVNVTAGLTFTPANLTISGLAKQNVTLKLSALTPAPLTISLSSANTAVATVPASVTIPANSDTVSVQVTAVSIGSAVIHASYAPYIPDTTANVTVQSAGKIQLPASTSVALTKTAPFPVTLPGPAPADVTISLSSSDASKVSIAPATVTVAAGATAPATQPQVTGVSIGTAQITASAAGYTSATAPVNVTASLSFSPASVSVSKGGSQSVTITLSAITPAAVTLSLSSDDTAVASVPASAVIPANANSVSVSVTGVASGNTIIRANGPAGVTGATANVTVGSDIILPASVSVAPGAQANLSVSIGKPATDAVYVQLTSSDPSKVTLQQPTVVIQAGQMQPAAMPRINGVAFGTATITASATGLTSATTTVTVGAALSFGPSSLTLAPSASDTIGINLSAPAPDSGLVVNLRSSDTGVVTVPASVTIPGGQAGVLIRVNAIALGTATLTASSTVPTVSGATATVTVATPGSLVLPASATVGMGDSVAYPIALSSPAGLNGLTVTLDASSANVSFVPLHCSGTPCPPVPSNATHTTVFIGSGQTTPAAQPQIRGVSPGAITVTASAPGYTSITKPVQVTASFTFKPSTLTIAPGSTGNLLLVLSGGAPPPPTGLTVTLTSSNPSVATVAASSTAFWDGSSPTSLNIPVSGVAGGTVTIRASSPNMADTTATITVSAPVSITTTALSGGVVNQPYTATLTAGGGKTPYTWTAGNLPPGLTLDASTGVISGIPTAVGTRTIVVTVTDATTPTPNTATKNLPVAISPALTITTTSLTGGLVGAPYSATLAAANGTAPYTWAGTGLPTGLTLNTSTGVISGTPTAVGTSNVAITVTDSTNPVRQTATTTLSLTIGQGLSITTAALPSGVVNAAYNATLAAAGGTLPYAWSATGLPAGLTLNTSTGVISGTPTTAVTSNVVITVSDASNPTHLVATKTLPLTIAPALAITTTALPGGVANTPYNATVVASGGTPPYTWSATGLPPGVSINTSTGVISGTPTAAGTNNVTITVTDSSSPTHLTASKTLSLTITVTLGITTAALPGAVVSAAYSATLGATGGTAPYIWAATGLPAGLTLNPSTGVISGAPTTAGASTVAITVTDSTNPIHLTAAKNLTLTVVPPVSITTAVLPSGVVGSAYAATLAAAGGTVPYTWSATGLPAGLTLNPSTGVINGAPTTPGTGTVALMVTDSTNPTHLTASRNVSITVSPALTITTTLLPGGVVSSAYTATLSATGGTAPYTWAATGLPAGLTLNPSTGVISGIPATAGTSTVAVTVTDSTNPTHLTVGTNLQIVIRAPLAIATAALPNGVAGSAYSLALVATGGTSPYTWSVTGLPAGLTLNTTTGVISGIPAVAGTGTLNITVQDSATPTRGTMSRNLSLTIAPALTITNTSLPSGATGAAYSTAVAVTGGNPPYTWAASGLPAGLTLNTTTGVISGTPTGSGTSNVILTVTDSTSPTHVTTTKSLSIAIVPPLSIATLSLPGGVVTMPYSTPLAASGGSSPYTWSATGLPAGLTLSATGVISGTPTAAGTSTVSITVTDSTAPTHLTATRNLNLTIAPPLSLTTTSLANGSVNAPYSATLAATGGTPPYSWAATGLPAGLSLNASTGVISGTPTTQVTATVAVTVTDSTAPTKATASRNLSLTIGKAVPASIVAIAGGGQSTVVGTQFATALQVSVRDASNTPIAGQLVTFTAPATGASLSFGGSGNSVGIVTNSIGVATSPAMTANAVVGSYIAIASVTGLAPASFSLTNTTGVPASALSVTSVSVGRNLQTPIVVSLPAPAGTGGVPVTVTSGDPTRILLGGNARNLVQVTIPEGAAQANILVQAVDGTGAATVTASATGYTDGTGTVTITPSGFVIAGPNDIGASFQTFVGDPTTLTVFSARLDSTGKYVEKQPLRSSLSLPVSIDVSSTSAGMVSPLSVSINPGNGSAPLTFTAVSTGTATVTAATPPDFTALTDASNTVNATVQPGGLTMPASFTVGRNLQVATSIDLKGVAPSGGTPMTITSDDPTRLRFSLSPNTAGTSSLTINLPANARGTPNFYVQAVGAAGTTNMRAQATGFGSGTTPVTIGPSGIVFTNSFGGVPNPLLASTGGSPVTVTVYSARLDTSGNWIETQALAGGTSTTVNVTNSGNAAVGTVTPQQVTISGGAIAGTTQFQPGSAGTTNLSVSVPASPAGFSAPAALYSTLPVNVTTPRIILTATAVPIGRNLQVEGAVILNQAAPTGGVVVTLTSNSAQLLLSKTATTAGANSIQVTVPAGSTSATYYAQSLGSSGTATYKATATGFVDGNASVDLTPSGVVISDTAGLPLLTIPTGTNTAAILVNMAQLNVSDNSYNSTQALRGGLSLNVTLTSGNNGIVTVNSPVTIGGGVDPATIMTTLTRAGTGSTAVTVTQPAGYTAATNLIFAFKPMPSIQVSVN